MAKIAKKIEELTGEDVQEQKEKFTFLQKMAEAKCAEFKNDLIQMLTGADREKYEIVGDRVINYYSGQHIDITQECDGAISNAVDQFFEGKDGIKSGFQSLIKSALNTMMGNTTIGEHQENMFFIYPEHNAIIRMDVKTYKYSFSKSGIIANCENIFCYTMAKSIVDHTKMSKDEIVYFVTKMCKQGKEKVDKETIQEFLSELVDIWNLLEGEAKPAFQCRLAAPNVNAKMKANLNSAEDRRLSMESFDEIFEK